MIKTQRRAGKMKTSVALILLSIFSLPLVEAGKEAEKSGTQSLYVSGSTGNTILLILREVEARLRNAEKKLEVLQGEVQDARVAFGASMGLPGRHIGPYKIPMTLAYKNIIVNTGSFNPETGIFTAPVKGIYYFSFSCHGLSSRPMGLRLMRNGKGITGAFNHPAGRRHETVTNGMSLQLEVGDQVYMNLVPHTWVFDNHDNPTTFIGHLLFRL